MNPNELAQMMQLLGVADMMFHFHETPREAEPPPGDFIDGECSRVDDVPLLKGSDNE